MPAPFWGEVSISDLELAEAFNELGSLPGEPGVRLQEECRRLGVNPDAAVDIALCFQAFNDDAEPCKAFTLGMLTALRALDARLAADVVEAA